MWLHIPEPSTLSRSVLVEAESKLASNLPCPEPSQLSFTVSAKPMLRRSWRRAWKSKPYLRRLSGLTCTLSESQKSAITFGKQLAARASVSSTAESPVSRTASLANNMARMIREIYGQQCIDSLRRIHRSSLSSSRMSQGCLALEGLSASSLNWNDWISVVRSACLRRRKLAQATSGSDCSSWPTACAAEAVGRTQSDRALEMGFQETLCGQAALWQTPCPAQFSKRRQVGQETRKELLLPAQAEMWSTPHGMAGVDKTGKQGAGGEFAKSVKNWPSPRSEDAESCGNHPGAIDSLTGATKLWPTPKATEHKGADGPGQGGHDGMYLTGAAKLWPMPASRDYKGTNSKKHRDKDQGHHDQLPNFVAMTFPSSLLALVPERSTNGGESSKSDQTSPRRLNGKFVEWLMGHPPGWTSFDFSGIPVSHKLWRQRSLACLRRYFERICR